MEKLYYCRTLEQSFTLAQLDEERKRYLADGDTYATHSLEAFLNEAIGCGELEEVRIVKKIDCAGRPVYTESNIKTDLC